MAFYKKYPWVIKSSVKEARVGSKVDGVRVAHGRICKIKCQETGKTRTVNVQDAWQCKFSEEVQLRKARERSALRRKARNKPARRRKTG